MIRENVKERESANGKSEISISQREGVEGRVEIQCCWTHSIQAKKAATRNHFANLERERGIDKAVSWGSR